MARKNKPTEKLDDSLSNDAHLGNPAVYLTHFTKKKSADRRGSIARRASHFVAIGGTAFILVTALLLMSFAYTGFQFTRELRAQVEETYNPSFRVRFDDAGEQTIRAWYGGLPSPVNVASNVQWPQGDDQGAVVDSLAPDAEGEEPVDEASPAPSDGGGADEEESNGSDDGSNVPDPSGDKTTTDDGTTADTSGTTQTTTEGVTISGLAFLGGEQIELNDNGENYASQKTRYDEEGKEIDADESKSAYAETLTYYAIINGWPSRITVTLGIPGLTTTNSGDLPVLLEAPSIETIPEYKASKMKTNPVDSTTESASKEVKDAVDNWTAAYVMDDRDSLKSLVRDPSGDKTIFVGMNGPWEWEENSKATISNSYSFNSDKTDETYMVATVSFDAKMVVTPATEATDDEPAKDAEYATTTTSMDILIEDYKGSIPQIVAWGPAGSGPTLTPYSNRVSEKSAPKHIERPTETGTSTSESDG